MDIDNVTVGHRLIDVVSAQLDVPVSAIMGSRGNPGLHARKVVYLAMRDREMPLTLIAKVFGRNHATVMDSLKKVTEAERELAKKANELLASGSTFFLQVVPDVDKVEVSVLDPQTGQRRVLEPTLAEELLSSVFRTETRVLGLR